METKDGTKAYYAKTRQQWRKWLERNSQSKKAVCLIIYHKKSKTKCISYPESIEEALCYGWIDSKANKRDSESFYQKFTPRKTNSNWSKTNRERVERLVKEGLMKEQGQLLITIAKQTGKWDSLVD